MSLAYHQRINNRRPTPPPAPRQSCSPLLAVRSAIENLTDDQVRDLVHTLVDGLVHGMIDDVAARADEVIDHITDGLIDVIGAATPEIPTAAPAAQCVQRRTRSKDKVQRTCELCGRTGSRRYIASTTGWRCAPSATKCVGNRRQASQIDAPQALRHRPQESPRLAPDGERPLKLVRAPGVTAQCQDCTRTWTLSGAALRQETEAHELARGHIITVHEQPDELAEACR